MFQDSRFHIQAGDRRKEGLRLLRQVDELRGSIQLAKVRHPRVYSEGLEAKVAHWGRGAGEGKAKQSNAARR